MRKTQLDALLNYFINNGGMTTFEAFERFGCTRLAARVLELSRKGYRFKKDPVEVVTRYGAKVTVTRYTLLDRREYLTGKYMVTRTGVVTG